MKTIIKIIGLIAIISGLAGVANAKPKETKPHVDPAHLNCSIILPHGQVIKGNGKNDLCLFYEETEGVVIFYHTASDPSSIQSLNTDEFLCELNSGEFMQVIKNGYRIDDYIVKAFGHIYTAYGVSSGHGIPDQLLVKNTTVKQFEPKTIIFNSILGEPTDIVVHVQGGRAPSQYKIKCEQIYSAK